MGQGSTTTRQPGMGYGMAAPGIMANGVFGNPTPVAPSPAPQAPTPFGPTPQPQPQAPNPFGPAPSPVPQPRPGQPPAPSGGGVSVPAPAPMEGIQPARYGPTGVGVPAPPPVEGPQPAMPPRTPITYGDAGPLVPTGPQMPSPVPGGGIGVPVGTPQQASYNQLNELLRTMPMASLTGIMGSGGGIDPSLFASLFGAAGQPGAAQQNLGGIAAGNLINSGNPYMDAIIRKSEQDVADQTNQLFAAGGRYGSAAHQGTLADSIADAGNQLRAQNYENERQRQMQAAGLISGEQQGRLGLQQGAASGLSGVQGQNIQNILGAISQLPTVQGNKIFDAQQQMQLGQQLDARSQAQLNDLINRWTQGDMEDWARLGGLLTMGQGAAGNFGTQTSNTTSSQSGGGLGALGGILSLFSLFSDRRMKADIRPDGTWRYAFGIPSLMGRFKGRMAQDMPKEAVRVVNGFLAVVDTRYAPEVV